MQIQSAGVTEDDAWQTNLSATRNDWKRTQFPLRKGAQTDTHRHWASRLKRDTPLSALQCHVFLMAAHKNTPLPVSTHDPQFSIWKCFVFLLIVQRCFERSLLRRRQSPHPPKKKPKWREPKRTWTWKQPPLPGRRQSQTEVCLTHQQFWRPNKSADELHRQKLLHPHTPTAIKSTLGMSVHGFEEKPK